jgi:hypothetical protein
MSPPARFFIPAKRQPKELRPWEVEPLVGQSSFSSWLCYTSPRVQLPPTPYNKTKLPAESKTFFLVFIQISVFVILCFLLLRGGRDTYKTPPVFSTKTQTS